MDYCPSRIFLEEYREEEATKTELFIEFLGCYMRKSVWQRWREVLKDRQDRANISSTSTLCNVGSMEDHTNTINNLQHNRSSEN